MFQIKSKAFLSQTLLVWDLYASMWLTDSYSFSSKASHLIGLAWLSQKFGPMRADLWKSVLLRVFVKICTTCILKPLTEKNEILHKYNSEAPANATNEGVFCHDSEFLHRLTHASTPLCGCALRAQPQSGRLAHTTICRAFGTPGGLLELPGD